MKRDRDQPPAAEPPRCGECGGRSSVDDRWLLHNVRHKNSHRRLCTHCVLNSFRGHFCPLCLDVFDPIDSPPLPNQRVMCLNCPSISHLSCFSGGHPFRCPSCSDPAFSFFTLRTLPDKRIKNDGDIDCSRDRDTLGGRVLDKESAKALVAAAKIAMATMKFSASRAKIDAERRVREAVAARKRAKDALEHMANLTLNEKQKKRELKSTAKGDLGIVSEQKMKPKVSCSVLESNKMMHSRIPVQNHNRLGCIPVVGMHSVLPVPAQNQQGNRH